MSATNQATNPSISNFTAIFDAASQEYKTRTKQDLATHPFAAALQGHNSPDSILNVFREQGQALDKIRKGDDKLMEWLTPIVNILFMFSDTLGDGVGLVFSPAKTIFTGIGVLLGTVGDVMASYETLLNLFERIQFFLQRLNRYTAAPLTPDIILLLGKIMAQILIVLAFSTKQMKERRIKKILKRIVGKTDVEDALQRLDVLTKEENLMMAARNLELTRIIHDHVEVTKHAMDGQQRDHLRETFRTWLSPPDPSINHNTACDTQHEGTAMWFIQGDKFNGWKKNSSLLWIRGNPGSGKSILSSAIIEDIQHQRETGPSLVAFYYFDFKDVAKRDVRGLLASALLQLVDKSECCWDTLHRLYKSCDVGSRQPSDAALIKCFKTMIDLPGQVAIYLIVDALDECSNITGTPSAREKVLNFIRDLIQPNHPNLFVCLTSRPEQDISATLNPLTSPSDRVSLHEEHGQMQAIDSYVRAFVRTDAAMRRWRAEDKELVINVLLKRAGGMFRWVFCQLDTLRRCMPSSIRKALDELPITLDGTYERMLQGIPEEKSEHASRLFQCMVVAVRPLRVEELAEIFAIDFGPNDVPNLVAGWRPENPEEAVLSTCSTFIAFTDYHGSKIVQFSHFSVKEFLTSNRLQASDVGNICQYYVPLEPAHAILAQACVTVLLQLDKEADIERVREFPLTPYATENWVWHTKFEDVASRIQDTLAYLFDPKMPHFRPRFLLRGVKRFYHISPVLFRDEPDKVTPLYLAAFCGFSWLANDLIIVHALDVDAKCGVRDTPLHGVSRSGEVESARVLLDHGADPSAKSYGDCTPLHFAAMYGHLKVVQLLENEVKLNAQNGSYDTPLSLASKRGQFEVVRTLLDRGADMTVRNDKGLTPYQIATQYKHHIIAEMLLKAGAEAEYRGMGKIDLL